LERVREIEAQIQQRRHRDDSSIAPTREELPELAADLESLWNDPQADARLKKRDIRTLIRDIIVDVDAQAGACGEATRKKRAGGISDRPRLNGT
jgi:ElaB/YqjD/DUF883 family membrane-anchored ribosome-binding protein